jgi:hypothetical protein
LRGPWLLSIDHAGVSSEVGALPASPVVGPGIATFIFETPSELHAALDRIYKLAVSLPDAPLARFRAETAALPRTTEAERLVIQRIGQDVFRDALMDYWGGRCPLTGINDPALLRASHIVPWADCTDEQRLDVHNGLLLSALWDAAFDQGLVGFADNGTVLASPKLSEAARKTLSVETTPLLHGLRDAHRANLAAHRARHGFSGRDDVTPMHSAYFETRFRTSQPITDWPPEFVILSAFATTGETWTAQQNEDADRHLASELRTRGGGWLVRIVGYSPTSGHAEPSWAVSLPLDEACNIGQRFHQDAIYHVKNDELSVTRCKDVEVIAPGEVSMGRVDYIGGHTIVFVSDGGTKWEAADRPAKQQDDSQRKRWDDEVGVEIGRGHRRVSKVERSFLSMCAVAFCGDVLSDINPKPPVGLQREVRRAGGNKKWIVGDFGRIRMFEEFVKRRIGKIAANRSSP